MGIVQLPVVLIALFVHLTLLWIIINHINACPLKVIAVEACFYGDFFGEVDERMAGSSLRWFKKQQICVLVRSGTLCTTVEKFN